MVHLFRFLSIVSVYLFSLNTAQGSTDQSLSTLRTVAIIHRHGDRTPIQTAPSDPYGDLKYWPDGWGQLTPDGKRRLYALGKFIRKRYASFLTNDPQEVKVRSSGANRCLNSVASLLAGAYPPVGRYVIEPDLKWQPFPIMTTPRLQDSMLNPSSTCAKGKEELERLRNSREARQFMSKYIDLLKYVSENVGRPITDYANAAFIYDDLFIERNNGYKLPQWATQKVLSDLQEIAHKSFHLDAASRLIQRLRAGVFFKDLTDRFLADHSADHAVLQKGHIYREYRQDEDDVPKKLHLYSTHDTMISVVLESMDAFNMLSPPYAASVIFELHEKNASHLVRIYYLNETHSGKLHVITPPGCDKDNDCKLGQFVKGMSHIIIDEATFTRECNDGPIIVHLEMPRGAIILALSGILVFLLGFAFAYIKRKKSSRKISMTQEDKL